MDRLVATVSLGVAALALAACTAVPAVPADGTPAVPGGDAARSALCDPANDTGLANLATQFEGVDDTIDVTLISTAIGTTMADLQSAQLDAGEMIVRDAAVTALGQLQTALSDPATRDQVAAEAAAALRAAETEIC